MKITQKFAAVAVLALASVSAHAELPAAATTALTAVQTDGLAMIDAGWPVLGAIVVGFVLMKLFKRVVSKAS